MMLTQSCLQYEVLRMFPPAPIVPRWTADKWEELTIDGKVYAISPGSVVKVDIVAMQHDPNVWGSDAWDFRPDRWIRQTSPETDAEDVQPAQTTSERTYDWQSKSLVSPATAGSFMPWTGGPRVCPGKKFSQVEFTRAVFEMFRDGARVRVAEEEGESQEEARTRAWEILNQTRISFVLKMVDSEKLGARWFVKDE